MVGGYKETFELTGPEGACQVRDRAARESTWLHDPIRLPDFVVFCRKRRLKLEYSWEWIPLASCHS